MFAHKNSVVFCLVSIASLILCSGATHSQFLEEYLKVDRECIEHLNMTRSSFYLLFMQDRSESEMEEIYTCGLYCISSKLNLVEKMNQSEYDCSSVKNADLEQFTRKIMSELKQSKKDDNQIGTLLLDAVETCATKLDHNSTEHFVDSFLDSGFCEQRCVATELGIIDENGITDMVKSNLIAAYGKETANRFANACKEPALELNKKCNAKPFQVNEREFLGFVESWADREVRGKLDKPIDLKGNK